MEKKTHVVIASLILSILVWLTVSMNNEYSVTIRVPFKVNNLPEGIALASPVPYSILVRVRGTGWQLASAYLSTTSAVNIDASSLEKRNTILTSRELGYSLNLGSSAEVMSLTPDTVTIMLDTVASKSLPIIPRIQVLLRNGFMIVGKPEVTPDSTTITGAQTLLDRIDTWYTEPKRFRNVMNEVDTKLYLSDSLKELVRLSTQEVDLKIDVEQITENTYRNVPVKILNNNDSVQILLLPPTVDVTIRGGINTMSEITSDSLHASVNYNSLIYSTSSHVHPDIEIPPTMQVIAIQPDSIEFVIRK